ncbi:MAG: FadR family transcriptional regulator [Rubellimicrobium sp.]|nr:FadR family transcriptional regulator [Rubellimicrobium sp.]
MPDSMPNERGNLVRIVEEALRSAITSGEVPVGGKLPSESEMTQRYGVSRTVVREAVSSLRLRGLVEARQGAGVFVISTSAAPEPQVIFRIEDPTRLSQVIEFLELRIAIEVEAASLAATRRSPAQAEAVRECWQAIERAMTWGKPSVDADFKFHLAIADATNNPHFRRLLENMGLDAIPRAAMSSDDGQTKIRDIGSAPAAPADYLRKIQDEHLSIADAVAAGDAAGARAAMRLHLEGSRDRYRDLLRRSR